MTARDRQHRKPLNPWHFIWVSVVVSELFTAILSTIQHHLSPEAELTYVLKVGAIDALFVPLIVAPVVIYFLRSTKELEKINAQLQHEVAERKRTESVLHTQEERLRLAMEATRQGWFDLNVQTGEVENSPEYARILGYEPIEFSNNLKSWIDGIHPEDRDSALKAFKECIETLEPRTIEYRRRTKADEWKWIRSIGKVVGFDADKRPLRMIGTHADISERKQAEEALRASEELLQSVVDSSADAIFVKDLQGRYVLMNKAGSALLGNPADEVIGKDDSALFPPTEAAKIMADDRNIITTATSVMYENSLTMAGGQRVLQVRKGPVFDSKGKVRGVYGISRDITERRQIEDALRSSENRYKAIVENQAEFVVRYIPGGVLTFINDTFLNYLDMKRDHLLGETFFPFLHEQDREMVVRQIESLDVQHPSQVAEARVVLPDGRITWHKWTHTAIIDQENRIIEYQATGRDITSSKRAEDALRASESRFRTIIENASAGIIVVDLETKTIRYANPAICRMLGYQEQDFLAIAITDLAVPEELPALIAGFQAHAEGKVNTTERTLRRKDGSSIRMAINSIRMEIDERHCLVGFFADVSEKHLLEEERLKTQKLEAIGTLAGGIAHDFNNLLQGVFGYISLAKLTANDREKSMFALEQAEKALHMSVKLTNQLLTFSKGGKPVKNVIDILPVIENAAKFALSGSRSNYRIAVDANLWLAEADEGQVGQVIQNIVLNADQAMPEGGLVGITVGNVQSPGEILQQSLAQGRYIEITIKDHGIGIPEQYLAKIFDPYFTTKEKGSGLGLATAYSIIRNHNGLIEVKSRMGKGTTFVIYLPAVGPAQKMEQPGPATETAEGRAGKVLVMDDEQVIRDIAGELLTALGHDVEFAKHGREAIEKYEAAMRSGKPFDLVILDLTIRGGMGGAEAMRRIRELDPAVNAVVSSGYSEDAIISTYRAQGFKAFLKKPYTVDALREVLRRLLST